MLHCFSTDGANVRAKNCVSIADVGNCGGGGFYHVSTYHVLKFMGIWTNGHIIDLSGPLCFIEFMVGELIHISFNDMDQGDFTFSWGPVMVIEATLATLEIYVLILSMDGKYVCCIII